MSWSRIDASSAVFLGCASKQSHGMPLLGLLLAKVLPHEDVEEVASRLGEKLVELVGGPIPTHKTP